MSSDLSGQYTIVPNFINKNTVPGLTAAKETVTTSYNTALANGTSDNQVDVLFTDELSALAISTSQTYNLSDGSIKDKICNTAIFAKVKTIKVVANAANLSDINLDLTVVNSFLGPFSIATKVALAPGAAFFHAAPKDGIVVTAATADLVTIENPSGANTAAYSIVITGTSA